MGTPNWFSVVTRGIYAPTGFLQALFLSSAPPPAPLPVQSALPARQRVLELTNGPGYQLACAHDAACIFAAEDCRYCVLPIRQ